jgi:hypothetical protein
MPLLSESNQVKAERFRGRAGGREGGTTNLRVKRSKCQVCMGDCTQTGQEPVDLHTMDRTITRGTRSESTEWSSLAVQLSPIPCRFCHHLPYFQIGQQ